MTDEPTDDLEQRLRADLAEIADAVPVVESPAPATNVVPITASSGGRRRPLFAVAGIVGVAAALLIGLLIWQGDEGSDDVIVADDPVTSAVTTHTTTPGTPSSTSTVPSRQPIPEGCPTLDSLEGATVRGESLQPDLDRTFPGSGEFGATDGGREVAAATDTLVVLGAQPVRPVIDFVGERTAQAGPILLWWADNGRVEAWVTVDGCDRVGLSVEGDKRDRNATAAYELALHVADRAVALMVAEQPEPCPDPGAQPSGDPTLFLYCPADDVDQVPVRYPAQAPPSTPTEALQALFRTDPPPGWGTGVPLQMRGADVDVVVTDGVARVIVDYDFEGAPINNFSTSFMSIAYGNQLQATLFQFPEIDAIDLDTLCCGEWGGLVTRAEWETWLAQATQE